MSYHWKVGIFLPVTSPSLLVALSAQSILLISIETNLSTPNASIEPLRPFIITPSKSTAIGVGSGVNMVRTLIRAEQTNQQLSCIEGYVEPKDMGPPVHLHKEADELMYVVEGTAGMMVDGEIFIVEAGGFGFRPHGLVHTFFNPSNKPLRFIDFFPNQGFEVYLEGMFFHIPRRLMQQGLQPGTPGFGAGFQTELQALDQQFDVVWFMNDPRYQEIVTTYGLMG